METCTALNMSWIIFFPLLICMWPQSERQYVERKAKQLTLTVCQSEALLLCGSGLYFFPPGLGREFETESIKNKRTDSSGDWTGWRIVSQTIWPWRPPPSPTQGGVIYQLHSSEHTWTLQRFIWWKLCCHVKKTSSEWNKKPDGHFKLKDNIRLKFGNISAHQVQQRRTSERGVIFWEKIQIKVGNSQD